MDKIKNRKQFLKCKKNDTNKSDEDITDVKWPLPRIPKSNDFNSSENIDEKFKENSEQKEILSGKSSTLKSKNPLVILWKSLK